MNKADKISKASKIIAESAKDNTNKNLLNYVKSNKIPLDDKQLTSLMQIIGISVDEGYQIALKNFTKTVNNILTE